MNVSRRKFLAAFSASVGTVILSADSLSAQLSVAPDRGRAALSKQGGYGRLTWNSIYPYQQTDFVFFGPDNTGSDEVRLRLTGMLNTDRAAQLFDNEPQSFVLAFDASVDVNPVVLPENTYSVKHFALGKFELFISEGSLEGDRHVYTAVINRAVS